MRFLTAVREPVHGRCARLRIGMNQFVMDLFLNFLNRLDKKGHANTKIINKNKVPDMGRITNVV